MMQKLYEGNKEDSSYLSPIELVELVREHIDSLQFSEQIIPQKTNEIFKYKAEIPIKQLFALYAINKITSTSNSL